MRILQVIHYFSPLHGGGSINVAYNLSKQLAERGHEVTIFTTDFEFDEEYVKSIEKEGLKVITFHCIVNIGLFLISPSMKKWLKYNMTNFDVIHMHNFRSYQNVVAYHYAKKHNIPYILQAHGSVLPFFQKHGLKKIFDIFFGYQILRDASKVIAVSKIEVEQYKKMGVAEDKIVLVPNGIDMSEYESLPEKGEFKKKYLLKDDEKIILYLGRIHKTKGIDILIDAFADLVKKLNNIKLVIAGPDDGFLSTLKKQIEDAKINENILITGPLYSKKKLEAYVDADVFVNPCPDEIFGLVFLEANACGTPVICSKGCGIADVFDCKTGFAVRNDKNQLRDAIFKVLSDEKLREIFGEGGRRLVREEYNWGNIVREMEKIYESSC